MKNDSAKQIKLGMILSYLNLGIGNLIPFFYTPIMLDLLGQSEYGLYKIASSTTSYLSLMAFGIGSAVSRFIIKARTQEGKEAEERMFGLFNLLFQTIALLTLIVGGLITWKLDLVYGASLTAAELSRMRVLVGLMVINTAVSFSATSYNAVVSSHERFLFIHSVNILSTIGTPILNLVVLFMGYRSIGMAVTSLALNILIRLIYIAYVRKSLDMKPRYQNMPRGALKEIFAFSFWVFVSNVVNQLYKSTDTVIIGAIPELATAGVAIYSIGHTFSNIMSNLAYVAAALFTPKVNEMVFMGHSDEDLSNMVIRVGRLQAIVVFLVTSGFAAFGQAFITWYTGEGYWEAYWVAIIMMVPLTIASIQSAAHSVLQAKNMHRFRSLMYIFIAVLNLIGTLLLTPHYGIIGAAIPTGFAFLIGPGLIMNWYYWKRVKLDIPRFWRKMCPIILISLVLLIVAKLAAVIIDFFILRNLICGIIVYTILYFALLWCFVLTKEEKQTVERKVMKFFVKNKYK